MTDTVPAPAPLSQQRLARRARIAEITGKQTELYEALRTNSEERDQLILDELNDPEQPAIARDLAELIGVSVGRIYKLRDNAKARQ
jgi:hypothetical protein